MFTLLGTSVALKHIYILFSTYDWKLLEGRNCTLSLFVKAMYLKACKYLMTEYGSRVQIALSSNLFGQ